MAWSAPCTDKHTGRPFKIPCEHEKACPAVIFTPSAVKRAVADETLRSKVHKGTWEAKPLSKFAKLSLEFFDHVPDHRIRRAVRKFTR